MTAADPTEAGLLAAVCESPGDDTPRLILADHYDETGRADRAELIRIMCRRGELRAGPAAAATRRAMRILGRQPAWLLPGVPLKRVSFYPINNRQTPGMVTVCGATTSPAGRPCTAFLFWHRGFVQRAIFTSQSLGVTTAPALLAEHPAARLDFDFWRLDVHLSVAAGWVARSTRPLVLGEVRQEVATLSRPTRAAMLAALPAFLRAESDAIAGAA